MPVITKPITIFPNIDKGKLVGSVTINGEEVKTRMTNMEINRRATVGIHTAKIILANINNQYSGKWSGGEVVRITADFSAGTTEMFEGYLVNQKEMFSRYPSLEINCSGYGTQAFNNPVFKKYTTATDLGQIFIDLIAEYLPSFTTTNVDNPVGITATPVWQGKDLWNCLKDLCIKHGDNNYDFFCDSDKDWNFFEKGTKVHGNDSGVAIVYGQNHRSTNLDDTFTDKKNKIIAIGKDLDGHILMSTKKNQNDIDNSWQIAEIIRDTNLTTQSAVDNAAQYILNNKITSGRSGSVTSDGLPGVLPGYKVMIFDPHNKMNGFFIVSEIKHELRGGDFRTTCTIHEQVPREDAMIELFKRAYDSEQEGLDIENEHGLENSYVVSFINSDQIDTTKSTGNIGISNGRLVLTSGTEGTLITFPRTADENITQVLITVEGSDYENCTFQVSTDNGITWESIVLGELKNLITNRKQIRYRVVLLSTSERPNPSLKSIGGLYR